MKVFWDPAGLRHDPRFFLQRGVVRRNFEVPARAGALLEACHAMGLPVEAPPECSDDAIFAVHQTDYVSFLHDGWRAWDALPERGDEMVPNIHPTPEMLANGAKPSATIVGQVGWYTADTSCPIGPETHAAARAAACCAIAAADEAARGWTAYALARPPGHHAYPARAGGHCYLNNAAIAAERLRARGAARVAVLDIDSHHGNGTQGTFWRRGDVLFVSVHGDPSRYYPWYVGHADERGGGAGEGCNLNLPLPLGSGDAGWLDAIAAGCAAIRQFAPDALVVSLGFDASKDEPLNALAVTEDGFARAGEAVAALRLPAALVQEGGYNVQVIGDLLTHFLAPWR
ncbi:MAG TPA: histone deacetylase family protein [Acidisphaera sp.]|nr:histone deacetylase family protein [Acidisphaera sp.]